MGREGFEDIFKVIEGHDVIMEFRQLVICSPLVHFSDVTCRTADSDNGQVDMGEPFDFAHLFADIFQAGCNRFFVGIALGIEFFRQGDGADGQRDGMDVLAVLDQGHFDTGTA